MPTLDPPNPHCQQTHTLRAALALFALLAVSPAGAADLTVPGDFPSIQAAMSAAVSGDHILVDPGVYVGSINFAGKDVVVESTSGSDTTIIDALGRTAAFLGPAGGLVGFTIENTNTMAIYVAGAGSLLDSNLFDGSTRSTPIWVVVYAGKASPVIQRNRFRGFECNGASSSAVLSFTGNASPIVVNNVFDDNACAAFRTTSSVSFEPQVVNNTFVGNTTAIQILRNASIAQQTYRNNLMLGNAIGLVLDSGTTENDPTWDHNLMYGNMIDHSEDPDPLGGGSNVSADPMLADVGAADYRLIAGSPAVDAGESFLAPTDDFDGTIRPLDGDLDGLARVDIGAFEMLPSPEDDPQTEVTIDVKPRSNRNSIRLARSRAVVPVALLGDDYVDVYYVDPDSLLLGVGGAALAHWYGPHFKDLNEDGYMDLVAHFRVAQTGIALGDEEVCLTGEISDEPFTACDTIRVTRARTMRDRRSHRAWSVAGSRHHSH